MVQRTAFSFGTPTKIDQVILRSSRVIKISSSREVFEGIVIPNSASVRSCSPICTPRPMTSQTFNIRINRSQGDRGGMITPPSISTLIKSRLKLYEFSHLTIMNRILE